MNFFNKVKNKVYQDLRGCNGPDQFSLFLIVCSLLISFVSRCFSNKIVLLILSAIQIAVLVYAIFRMVSKKVYKRREENTKFLLKYNPIKNAFIRFFRETIGGFFKRLKDKEHHYYKCSCGTYLRYPKGKGKIKLTCPKCNKEYIRKS